MTLQTQIFMYSFLKNQILGHFQGFNVGIREYSVFLFFFLEQKSYKFLQQRINDIKRIIIRNQLLSSKNRSKQTMDKHIWRQVKTLSSSSHRPSSRWGHSSCVVGEQIVFFGGYADTNYMNDLWAFNSVTMKWREIQTFGDIPRQRSNCTMNYDQQNKQIVIFGGGGANKQRFNCISILDWNTKNWIQINPKQNEVAPWERTYHVAELISDFLVIFGGQGVADMDDLWVFNFNTLSWTQVKFPAGKIKPCARRFHSSVTIGNQFIVLAGCYGKYRCLSDVFSIDLTTLVKTSKFDQLQWKQKKLKDSSYLTRWGHSSAVYDNKIYIFGGRFSNDLNDLLVADFQSNSIRGIKTNQQAPPARRRHCAGFIGSSMLVFGGFNGKYFQDFYYISLHQAKTKFQISTVFDEKNLTKYINNRQYADCVVKSKQDLDFYINIGLISKHFENEVNLGEFLERINSQYSIQDLADIFVALYNGYGELNVNSQLQAKLKAPVFKRKSQKIVFERQRIEKPLEEVTQRRIFKKAMQTFNPLIKLDEQDLIQYYSQQKNYSDLKIIIGKYMFSVNKVKLMAKSQYFFNLISKSPLLQQFAIQNILAEQSRIVYEVLFNFLESDWLVVPDNISVQTMMQLSILADYFCVPVLSQICCNELLGMITNENIENIMYYSIHMKLTNLTKACCDHWIKKATQTIKFSDLNNHMNIIFGQKKKICKKLETMLSKISFDLAQNMIQNEKMVKNLSKKQDSNSSMQKQNYETNIQNH